MLSKGDVIRQSLAATRAKRKHQTCHVYELKVLKRSLSALIIEQLQQLFLEGKWFYNHILAHPDVFTVDDRVKKVTVKVGDYFETRSLKHLSSQMKQGIVARIHASLKSLATKKKNGEKVGQLKFIRSFRAIPLKQYGNTYRLEQNGSYVKLQRFKPMLKLKGFTQIPRNVEFANAVFIKKHGDYFLKVTVFEPKSPVLPPFKAIGIDCGIKTQLAFSNGILVAYELPEKEKRKLRHLYKKFSRKRKGSHNWHKALRKIEKQFAHLTNIKADIRNKIVSYLKKEYQIVCFQQENLKIWQRIYGKQLLDTSLGGILSALKERVFLPSEVDRFYPSTQLCCACSHQQKLARSDRTYVCPACGLFLDRDVNAAKNVVAEGLFSLFDDCYASPLGSGRPEFTPVEIETSTETASMLFSFNTIPYVRASLIVESGIEALSLITG